MNNFFTSVSPFKSVGVRGNKGKRAETERGKEVRGMEGRREERKGGEKKGERRGEGGKRRGKEEKEGKGRCQRSCFPLR